MQPYAIDFETTGKDATTARPIEWALASCDDGAYFGAQLIALPPGETIPPETSAVHHIIDKDLEGAPYWPEALVEMWNFMAVDGEIDDVVLVAHNAEYEQGILAGTHFAPPQKSIPWVCTWKCALVVWPEAPSHSNEGLRYWLQLGRNRGRAGNQRPHSALHDAQVTAGIFNKLVEVISANGGGRDEAIRTMIQWSSEMPKLPTCPIGQQRGQKWEDIESGFLSWCLRQPDMRPDVKHCCEVELLRRRNRGPGRGQG